jgi:DNA polymerase IV
LSPRVVRHAELHRLAIAHIDCDAFYASIEKRDNPDLADKPVIVGGNVRGVVSTACYVARIMGVKSAMPMFKALELCPGAVVIKPDMAKYAEAGRQVRSLMNSVTPLVEPLSIDEAFMDLSGTDRLHGQSPAATLAKLIRRIENEVGITASVGLSHNKFLAKIASDLQKPRGFSVVGKAETGAFLAAQPIGIIWGVGKAMQAKLAQDGLTRISQLQTMDQRDLMKRYGSLGLRLHDLSRGNDFRDVSLNDRTKSISAETTFDADISDYKELEAIVWRLCEKVSRRAKRSGLAGQTVTLKLKTADFKTRTRAVSFEQPSLLAYRIFDAAKPLLAKETTGARFRLIGIGISHLAPATAEDEGETLDQSVRLLTKAEQAMDKVRAKFGNAAIERGIAQNFRDDGSRH